MTIRSDELLAQLVAIAGPDRVDDFLAVAVEAAKINLRAEDLIPRERAWQWLGILGMQPKQDGQGFYAWSREHHLVTDAQWEEARRLDLLAMKPDQPCPVHSPIDGADCIRELHHGGRHIDETGWVW